MKHTAPVPPLPSPHHNPYGHGCAHTSRSLESRVGETPAGAWPHCLPQALLESREKDREHKLACKMGFATFLPRKTEVLVFLFCFFFSRLDAEKISAIFVLG